MLRLYKATPRSGLASILKSNELCVDFIQAVNLNHSAGEGQHYTTELNIREVTLNVSLTFQ